VSCAAHPKVDHVARCAQCDEGVCRDCVVHTGVGIKCRTCTGEAARPARAARSAANQGRGRRPRWTVPAAVAGAVALVAGFLAFRGGGGVDNKNRDEFAGQTAEQSTEFERLRKADWVGGAGVRISGELTRPIREIEIVGGALIVPGFGAIDKDATMAASIDGSADRLSQDLNYSRPGTADNLFRDLNDSLLAAGLLTLRYDKRGSGASPLTAEQPMSFDDLVADARGGLTYLAERFELAGKPIAVVGFDQGGLVALRLASDPRVRNVALLSTFARPLADVIGADFLAARPGDNGRAAAAAQLKEIAAGLAAGRPLPAEADINGHLRPLLRANQETYLRQIFALDAAAEARNAKRPTLLVRGGRDTTVTGDDSAALKAALAGGAEEIVVVNGDHNLGDRGARDPVIVSQLAAWVRQAILG